VNHVKQGSSAQTATYQRTVLGIVAMLATLVALLAVMLPFRTHLSVTIPALAFVLPALVGVSVGGSLPGAVGALAGFLAYDYFFLPPYGTLTVRSSQNWIALVVYVAVVLVVAQVVARLRDAREEAVRRNDEAGRLFELSQALIGDLSEPEMLSHIVETVQETFSPEWTALVLPEYEVGRADGPLRVVATAGRPLKGDEVSSLTSARGQTRSLGLSDRETPSRLSVALVVGQRPVGMLVLQGARLSGTERDRLGTFANQAALAVDRARLRDEAVRARLLEEIDTWHRALMGAVSHDLRTPLASVKTAVSSLRQPETRLAPHDRAELLELIEQQTDRLSRLVTNLLDMTRIDSGSLELRPAAIEFDELVDEALGSLGDMVARDQVAVDEPSDLPLLHIDHVLMSQVLANVVENAVRHSPPRGVVRIDAKELPGQRNVEIGVADDGPGIASADRERVFEMFSQHGGGGRAGLGLAIAKAFVEAHGGHIWVDPARQQGARVVFTVPVEAAMPAPV
jgi:two-component system, OmpR family, sensor histidine kinase KdpD